MPYARTEKHTLKTILWESLEGGNVDLEALKVELGDDSSFREAGLDSLDLTDFFLRIQDHFRIAIRQEDFAQLVSLNAVSAYLERKLGVDEPQATT